ncbi:MAG: hypothetical protein ACRDZ4_18930 [Egibacteraceae bacterium]
MSSDGVGERRPNGAITLGLFLGFGVLALGTVFAAIAPHPGIAALVGLGAAVCTVAGFVAGRASLECAATALPGNEPFPAMVFELELERSRRFSHPFTIMRVETNPALGGHWPHETPTATASRLREWVRSVDVVWEHGSSVYLLLPECSQAQAAQAFARIADLEPGLCRPGRVRTAVFPVDGLTVPALLRALEAPVPVRQGSGVGSPAPAGQIAWSSES